MRTHAKMVPMRLVRRFFSLARQGNWRRIAYVARMKLRRMDLHYASLNEIGLSEERSLFYVNSGGPELESILASLPISPSDQVLDLGSGKGGAMLTFARFPFARVDGVELSESLVAIAKRNLGRMGVRNCTIYHCDAAEFRDYARYNFLYMYHPFPTVVMTQVMRGIMDSLAAHPRRIVLIYRNPVLPSVVEAAGFQKTAEFPGSQYPTLVYVKDPPEIIPT